MPVKVKEQRGRPSRLAPGDNGFNNAFGFQRKAFPRSGYRCKSLGGHGYYMMIAAGIESLYPPGMSQERLEDIGRFLLSIVFHKGFAFSTCATFTDQQTGE